MLCVSFTTLRPRKHKKVDANDDANKFVHKNLYTFERTHYERQHCVQQQYCKKKANLAQLCVKDVSLTIL